MMTEKTSTPSGSNRFLPVGYCGQAEVVRSLSNGLRL